MFAICLECVTCGKKHSLGGIVYECTDCSEPLQVTYNYAAMRQGLSKAKFEQMSAARMWQFAPFLPIPEGEAVSLGEGTTPLIPSDGFTQNSDSLRIYYKLDFLTPTGSFKDRGASVLISKAKELRRQTVAIDSSGNAACALAAYSAKAGLKCVVYTPAYASPSKLLQATAFNADVVRVQGTREDVHNAALSACEKFEWYYCGFQGNPFAVEGAKTIAYEICRDLNWKAPDYVVVPTATGSGLEGCWRGMGDLLRLGWIDAMPRFICVQPKGCAPIASAFLEGSTEIKPVDKPQTIAEGLAVGRPRRGRQVLKALRETAGFALTVSDDEILREMHLLAAQQGVFVEPSAASAVAGTRKTLETNKIKPSSVLVCLLTGAGLKTPEKLANTT